MTIRSKTIEISPEISLVAVSDFHMGDASRSDNAVPSRIAINTLASHVNSGSLGGFLIIVGDLWERWQSSKSAILKAWGEIQAWLQSAAGKIEVLCGNHDQDMGSELDMLFVKWGNKSVGFVHDPTFEWKGWKKALAKWAVETLWTPWEKLLGWKKGKELSSAVDSIGHSDYERAAFKMLADYSLDIIVYGHTHQKPFARKTGSAWIINTGKFQDGRGDIVRISNVGEEIKVVIHRIDNNGTEIA